MQQLSFSFIISVTATGQKKISNVEFIDYKRQVLLAKKEAMKAQGKLNAGDIIGAGCDQGACWLEIDYKGRKVKQNVGDDITELTVYEFDFSADADLELVVINDFKATAFLYVFSYSKGIVQKLFEKEIKSDKVVIKKDYIEYYEPGARNQSGIIISEDSGL
ncbi:MAG: hypothetical protein MZV64_28730 [Ignavibacteriales bacterium]|nr:hypothetical protein [Ignavibacteriales bacterium]